MSTNYPGGRVEFGRAGWPLLARHVDAARRQLRAGRRAAHAHDRRAAHGVRAMPVNQRGVGARATPVSRCSRSWPRPAIVLVTGRRGHDGHGDRRAGGRQGAGSAPPPTRPCLPRRPGCARCPSSRRCRPTGRRAGRLRCRAPSASCFRTPMSRSTTGDVADPHRRPSRRRVRDVGDRCRVARSGARACMARCEAVRMASCAAGGRRRVACLGDGSQCPERRSSCVWRRSGARTSLAAATMTARGLTFVLTAEGRPRSVDPAALVDGGESWAP